MSEINYIENVSRPTFSFETGDTIRTVYVDGSTVESIYTNMNDLPQNRAPALRIITKRAFMQRFTQPERIAIRKSTDDIVIDVYDDLKFASYVDLDDVAVAQALGYFVSISILESERVAAMLVDGITQEAL